MNIKIHKPYTDEYAEDEYETTGGVDISFNQKNELAEALLKAATLVKQIKKENGKLIYLEFYGGEKFIEINWGRKATKEEAKKVKEKNDRYEKKSLKQEMARFKKQAEKFGLQIKLEAKK